jgi:thiamine kinase-like enzyme
LQLSRQLGLARESFFFNELAEQVKYRVKDDKENPQYIQFIPRVYYAYGNIEDGNKFIVMEDLSSNYIDSGILFGPGNPNNWTRNLTNKITEAYPPPSIAPTSFEVAKQTFLAIAKVHATFWKDGELLSDEYNWLRGSSWINGKDEASWNASQGLIQSMWSSMQSGIDTRINWDPLVKKIVESAMKGISWESQQTRLNASTNWCLCHGDFWPGNVMISKTNTHDLRLLDWEMTGLGSGPQDLGQYVLSNMDPEERRKGEFDLVKNYFNELVRLGVHDFSWEECWAEYKIGGLERWLWFLVYFCAQSGTLLSWAQFFHDQIKEFVHDHKIQPDDVTQPRP